MSDKVEPLKTRRVTTQDGGKIQCHGDDDYIYLTIVDSRISDTEPSKDIGLTRDEVKQLRKALKTYVG